MRISLLLLSLAASLAVTPASAQWYQDGKPARSGGERAAQGKFKVLQLATTDSEGFLKAWAVATPGANVSTSSGTVRNQPITTYLIFAGCAADVSGNCNVTTDFEVIGPDGKSYATQLNAPVWRRTAPEGVYLQLSEAALGLIIEQGEALGAYRVRAKTTDHVAGITLSTEQTLTVAEAK